MMRLEAALAPRISEATDYSVNSYLIAVDRDLSHYLHLEPNAVSLL